MQILNTDGYASSIFVLFSKCWVDQNPGKNTYCRPDLSAGVWSEQLFVYNYTAKYLMKIIEWMSAYASCKTDKRTFVRQELN